MTREEAIEMFGKGVMMPALRELFARNGYEQETHCKVGATYWWCAEGPSRWNPKGDEVWRRTKKAGWTRLTCVYRRSGINFLHIEGDVPSYEIAAWNGSDFINQLIPEIFSQKAFHKNPELDFVWKTLDGRVKIID